MLTGYRIAAPDFASDISDMMSGEGAYLFGGRWNSKGTRAVYLGTSLAQAAMELLMHLGRSDILNTYIQLSVSFDESLVEHIDLEDLPDDWREASMAPRVQATGDAWIEAQSSVILQVPSAAVMGEYNYLVNPAHPEFSKLRYGEILPFKYDARLQR
ncbi:MAG: RES domain-containing protein [Cellvibrionaceae bacterium]|nr:RES domain-containing protein [Cellvibrionaceae bacterium]